MNARVLVEQRPPVTSTGRQGRVLRTEPGAAILGPFLARDTIYATDHARESWEDAARANLAAELKALTAP